MLELFCKDSCGLAFISLTTSRYNAPEVFMQDQSAIHSSRLHQCDIWAYGLLVWEIFLHGAAYFNPAWRKDPKFAASDALGASSAYISETIQSFVPDENKFEVYRHDCFGHFDMRFTGELGIAFMEQIDDPTHILKGAQMVNVIKETLAYEPSQRASDMSSLKIFNEGYVIPQPPATLAALQPGQLKLSIDMFNCYQVQDFSGTSSKKCTAISDDWP
jgi:serine/threonine protein kinase